MNTARLAPWAAAAVGVQVGATIVATRFVVAELAPVPLALARYVIGLLSLLPFVWALRGSIGPIERRDLPRAALLGIGQFGLLIALLNLGLQQVPAARAALLFASFPLMTLVVAAVLGHERLSAAKVLGVGLSLAGVALALGPGIAAPGASLRGEAFVLASALCGALCSVLYRPVLRRNPALPVGAVAMAAAVVFLGAWTAWEGTGAQLPRLSARGALAVLFIGASSGIGYFLWLWALRHAAASRVTLFLSLSPITAMLLGALWLGEALPLRLWLALGLVLAGLWAAHREAGLRS